MTNITNIAKKTDEAGEVNRAQIEHRALWMALMYDEMVTAGVDAEGVIRRAIRRCGRMHGEALKEKCKNPADCTEFSNVFLSSLVVKTFDMRPIKADKDSLDVAFHYCALVAAWQKLGLDDTTCALLCDIAMEGDRGIAEALGLTLSLPETIAGGCPNCKLRFHA